MSRHLRKNFGKLFELELGPNGVPWGTFAGCNVDCNGLLLCRRPRDEEPELSREQCGHTPEATV